MTTISFNREAFVSASFAPFQYYDTDKVKWQESLDAMIPLREELAKHLEAILKTGQQLQVREDLFYANHLIIENFRDIGEVNITDEQINEIKNQLGFEELSIYELTPDDAGSQYKIYIHPESMHHGCLGKGHGVIHTVPLLLNP